MPDVLRCFVNERALSLTPGATVREAVAAFDAALADRCARGEAYVTDARGIRVSSDLPLSGGRHPPGPRLHPHSRRCP